MDRVDTCPACESTDLARQAAVVAPFLVTYAGARPDTTDLCECRGCGLAFYDRRLTADEASRLYAEYRGPAYQRARQRVEPLYTRGVNRGIGDDDATIALRREKVGALVARAAASSVLDYGGDAGQFIPDGFERRYVHEISDVDPIDGVERYAGQQVDLVMLAHVLEHVADPCALLLELSAVAGARWLYVEVPLDRPATPPAWFLPLHQRWVRWLSRGWRRTALADVVSTPVRVLLRGRWVPFTFPKAHEHLQHWDERSLTSALGTTGWRQVESMTYGLGGRLRMNALGVLLTRP